MNKAEKSLFFKWATHRQGEWGEREREREAEFCLESDKGTRISHAF